MKQEIPWQRLTVEAVVIVGSILLAFAIDAWWEQLGESSKAESYLRALREEIQVVQEDIEFDQERRRQRGEFIQSLVSAISEQKEISQETMNQWLGEFWGAARSSSSFSVLDDLTSSGNLDLIESDEFRFALLQYNAQRSRLAVFENRLLASWEDGLRPYLVQNTDALRHFPVPPSSSIIVSPTEIYIFDDGYQDILQDREFQNLLLVRLRRTLVAMSAAENVMQLSGELISIIDELLSLNIAN